MKSLASSSSLLLLLIVLLVILSLISSKAIIPTKSSNKKGFNSWLNTNSLTKGLFREIKTLFCSELEALTLTLTKPADSSIPLKSMDELVSCLNVEGFRHIITITYTTTILPIILSSLLLLLPSSSLLLLPSSLLLPSPQLQLQLLTLLYNKHQQLKNLHLQ